jgi:hypothetical protein
MQFRPGRRQFGRLNLYARPHHKIYARYYRARMTEHVTRQPLVRISRNRFLHDALANDHAQACQRGIVGPRINLEPPPGHPAFVGENRSEGMRPIKAPRARKRKFLAFTQTLNGETRAAFGAASADYCSAGAGLHAHTKSVCAFAPGGRRLVGPFHDVRPVNVKSPLLQPVTPFSVNENTICINSAPRRQRLWITTPKKAKLRNPSGHPAGLLNHHFFFLPHDEQFLALLSRSL